MTQNYKSKKVLRKQQRCIAVVEKDCGVQASETPTHNLAILNAGLSTGLTEELVLTTVNQHGAINQLFMLPNKSYCFLECATIKDAESIYETLHNCSHIGQNEAVVYLSYFKELPTAIDNKWLLPLPNGLIILPNFITPDEEALLLTAINNKTVETVAGELKHRQVQHFGYEFIYGKNNVDINRPLDKQIPTACDILWPRLQLEAEKLNLKLDWQIPDQLTVNKYAPGHGIPSHVDTHSAFLDPILSLSLQSDVVMEFRRGNERVPVLLPKRSLLIMSGESRYDWMHGITPHVYDVVQSSNGALTLSKRTERTSLTFRKLRRAPCNCNFPTLCDTHIEKIKTTATTFVTEDDAANLEEQNVHKVYDEIANHFSETRHTPWPQVAEFIDSFVIGSVLLDIGCGNGKYLHCNRNILSIGCDRTNGLLNVCVGNNKNAFRCDCLNVPVRSASVDACISIAVIHHLATEQRRLAAVKEMARVLRKGGRALIYVWAKDQKSGGNKSSYLRQNKAVNKSKVTEDQQRQLTAHTVELQSNDLPYNLPVHTNRTEFQQQDVLVPWKLKGADASINEHKATFLRYYHVFEEKELEALVAKLEEVDLISSYYDQGNHCVIFERK
ncbi:alkylated DNA repair protein alkB homolog 8-like [Teleopsis dalmanni]|uniref:alkylated DNA repair protein alkB homolog 8-like n=1 Tax=Teleopsis dalmanni TaxID=139649 RepID=UPI0018CE1636|nr:alkylated DNA repair protein alkB homolog 8-like [Teleopsis dalmanni]